MFQLMYKLRTISIILITTRVCCDNPLKVTVFYESGCGDCVNFFNTQFTPHWRQFGGDVIWQLIPYGNVEQIMYGDECVALKCQHGQQECQDNKFHACLLSKLADEKDAYDFVSCYMQNKDIENTIRECERFLKLDYEDLIECSRNTEGLKYFFEYGILTDSTDPKINFIPAIAFDGNYDPDESEEALTNLVDVICKKLNRNVSQLPGICYIAYEETLNTI